MIRRPTVHALAMFAALALLAAPRTGQAQRVSQLPGHAPQGETVAGIACDAMEGARLHTHQHLVLIDRGKEVQIPADVGQRPERNCLYWVHTHTPDGIIHIESPSPRTFTLGDFFTIWGQPLDRAQAATMRAAKGGTLKIWVNGQPYAGDPRAIPLLVHSDIVIEAGPPFVPPPKFTNWGTL